jgi:hypothetical protein
MFNLSINEYSDDTNLITLLLISDKVIRFEYST